MTTLEAPSVTPCPVAWWLDAGGHEWDEAPDHTGDQMRIHTRRTLRIKTGPNAAATVEAEAFEREDGSVTMSVQIPFDSELYTWEQVEQVIAGVRAAADLAFGPALDAFGPERAELEAAVAEVAMRADNPTDVNRLVAAVIRLREARAMLTR